MEKSKRIHRPTLIQKLDFVSPHELSQAVSLFERAAAYRRYDSRLELSPYELSVQIVCVDDDTCRFRAEWKYMREDRIILPYQFVKANGYLKRWDRKSTHIFGKVELPILYCVLLTFVCAAITFLGLISLLTGEQLLLGMLVTGSGILTLVLQLRALNDLQRKMADIIVTALHPMPEQLGYDRIYMKFGKPRHRHHS